MASCFYVTYNVHERALGDRVSCEAVEGGSEWTMNDLLRELREDEDGPVDRRPGRAAAPLDLSPTHLFPRAPLRPLPFPCFLVPQTGSERRTIFYLVCIMYPKQS